MPPLLTPCPPPSPSPCVCGNFLTRFFCFVFAFVFLCVDGIGSSRAGRCLACRRMQPPTSASTPYSGSHTTRRGGSRLILKQLTGRQLFSASEVIVSQSRVCGGLICSEERPTTSANWSVCLCSSFGQRLRKTKQRYSWQQLAIASKQTLGHGNNQSQAL